ncbi:MAG TPA: hypothetical protein DDW52_11435, partial [Planctomycetaceae bacterium]|nr:hypothetical protein [Planctomycetaceae bacterium]
MDVESDQSEGNSMGFVFRLLGFPDVLLTIAAIVSVGITLADEKGRPNESIDDERAAHDLARPSLPISKFLGQHCLDCH